MIEQTEQPMALVTDDEATARAAALAEERAGWMVLRGWSLPAFPWDVGERRIVCSGVVANPEDASEAVLAAARGARLVVLLRAVPGVAAPFIDDLKRIGPVEQRKPGGVLAGVLDDDQRRLLALLAQGKGIGEAAEQLFLSRRTAERRLASARQALGVRTTSEAIIRLAEPTAG